MQVHKETHAHLSTQVMQYTILHYPADQRLVAMTHKETLQCVNANKAGFKILKTFKKLALQKFYDEGNALKHICLNIKDTHNPFG